MKKYEMLHGDEIDLKLNKFVTNAIPNIVFIIKIASTHYMLRRLFLCKF